jgi:hypothetical protein
MGSDKTKGQKYDRELLISKIAMMRIKGKSTHGLIEFLMTDIKVSRPTAYEILKDAQKLIIDMYSDEIDASFKEAISKLEDIYETAEGKLKLEVQKEINKLKGLYATEKIEINHKIEMPLFPKEDDE